MTFALELYAALLGALMLAWVLRRRRPPRSRTARRRTRSEELERKCRVKERRRFLSPTTGTVRDTGERRVRERGL